MSDKIVVNNLNYRVNDKNILQSISIKVKDGQFVGIIGPKRMDYENVVRALKTLKIQLNSIFKIDNDE